MANRHLDISQTNLRITAMGNPARSRRDIRANLPPRALSLLRMLMASSTSGSTWLVVGCGGMEEKLWSVDASAQLEETIAPALGASFRSDHLTGCDQCP